MARKVHRARQVLGGDEARGEAPRDRQPDGRRALLAVVGLGGERDAAGRRPVRGAVGRREHGGGNAVGLHQTDQIDAARGPVQPDVGRLLGALGREDARAEDRVGEDGGHDHEGDEDDRGLEPRSSLRSIRGRRSWGNPERIDRPS